MINSRNLSIRNSQQINTNLRSFNNSAPLILGKITMEIPIPPTFSTSIQMVADLLPSPQANYRELPQILASLDQIFCRKQMTLIRAGHNFIQHFISPIMFWFACLSNHLLCISLLTFIAFSCSLSIYLSIFYQFRE